MRHLRRSGVDFAFGLNFPCLPLRGVGLLGPPTQLPDFRKADRFLGRAACFRRRISCCLDQTIVTPISLYPRPSATGVT